MAWLHLSESNEGFVGVFVPVSFPQADFLQRAECLKTTTYQNKRDNLSQSDEELNKVKSFLSGHLLLEGKKRFSLEQNNPPPPFFFFFYDKKLCHCSGSASSGSGSSRNMLFRFGLCFVCCCCFIPKVIAETAVNGLYDRTAWLRLCCLNVVSISTSAF